MNRLLVLLSLMSIQLCISAGLQDSTMPVIIPQPLKVSCGSGQFVFTNETPISFPKAFASEAHYLMKALHKSTGNSLSVAENGIENGIHFIRKPEGTYGKEAYKLAVKSTGIVIEASQPAGAFYAVQSLLQMLPNEVLVGQKFSGKLAVASVIIEDEPRFAWRAYMLDEARHFKGQKEVEKILDQMAQHKMNIFHWHLTDDQGWRIEIKKYPRLTTVGSKRESTELYTWGSGQHSGVPHSGFYTQEEIKEIVDYAKQRHIEIIPEIGMPGHAAAAIASYPYLGCRDEEIAVMSVFGKGHDVYNPAKESTYKFISDVIDEVMLLFPSQFIHIGGDEVRFGHWQKNADVQNLMREKGLKTMADVQIYFTNRVAKLIEGKGRNVMGWNEILGEDLHGFLKNGQTASAAKLDPKTNIHFWKGSHNSAKKAIAQGHDIINSIHSETYLDYGYGRLSLERAYRFDPIFNGLAKKYHHKVKGFGMQMWGEWIPTVKSMENQMYPRFSAYAEIGWTALERKDFGNFKKRMQKQMQRWDLLGIHYAKEQVNKISAADFFNHVKIGSWEPAGIKRAYGELEFDITSQVQAPGTYEAAFLYEKGAHAIDIEALYLCENGEKISQDRHLGFSGTNLRNITYNVELKKFKKGARYSLKASIKGSGGCDSYGQVKLMTK